MNPPVPACGGRRHHLPVTRHRRLRRLLPVSRRHGGHRASSQMKHRPLSALTPDPTRSAPARCRRRPASFRARVVNPRWMAAMRRHKEGAFGVSVPSTICSVRRRRGDGGLGVRAAHAALRPGRAEPHVHDRVNPWARRTAVRRPVAACGHSWHGNPGRVAPGTHWKPEATWKPGTASRRRIACAGPAQCDSASAHAD